MVTGFQMRPGGMTQLDPRQEICKTLGIQNPLKAHEIITAGAQKGGGWLLHKGLNAKKLIALGYTAEGMKRLGYKEEALEALGYPAPPKPKSAAISSSAPNNSPAQSSGSIEALTKLVESGKRASELRALGFTVQHCRKAGYSASEMVTLGYKLEELAGVFSATE